MDVLIAGGGIGGLTAGICLTKAGHNVRIFERAHQLRKTGAGIQLSPNPMHVMAVLGLSDQIKAKGFLPRSIETRMGRSGRQIFELPVIDAYDTPYVHIHRAVLIDILAEEFLRLSPKGLALGQTVNGYHQDEDQITLTLDNGESFSGDILIGADGIHSQIRGQMLGPDKPQFTRNVAWRAVIHKDEVKGDLPPPTACAWMGPGRHAVTYHLGDDLINFVGVVEQDGWQVESWTEPGDHSALIRDFEGWHSVISNLVKAINPQDLYRWALFDRAPLCHWTHGRAALLGDSAHPMLPFLAQGAAMAIEDALILAQEISKADVKIGDALLGYQDKRYQRTSRMQAASRSNMKIFHRQNWLSQMATYGPMWLGGKIAPGLIKTRMDWIYDYKV